MRKELHFIQDEVIVSYVANLGHSLVRAAGPQPLEYRFYVVEDDSINAFAGPGGYIYVHTETILQSKNASELAGVLAHEVGHVVKRHVAQNYERSRSASVLHQATVVAADVLLGGVAGSVANLGGGLVAMGVLNSFGREAEREADQFAVEVMPIAGYHPEGLVNFFRTLEKEGGGSIPAFLSDHPTTSDRMQTTLALIQAQGLPPGLKTLRFRKT